MPLPEIGPLASFSTAYLGAFANVWATGGFDHEGPRGCRASTIIVGLGYGRAATIVGRWPTIGVLSPSRQAKHSLAVESGTRPMGHCPLMRLPPSHHSVRNVGAVPLVGCIGITHWPRSRDIISVVENDLFLGRIFDDGAGIVIDVERDVVAGAMPQRPPDQLRLPAISVLGRQRLGSNSV